MAFFFGTESVRKSARAQAIPTGLQPPVFVPFRGAALGCGAAHSTPLCCQTFKGSAVPCRPRQQRARIVTPRQAIRLKTRALVPLLPLWWLPWWIAASIPRAVGASICSFVPSARSALLKFKTNGEAAFFQVGTGIRIRSAPACSERWGRGAYPTISLYFFKNFL